MDGELFESLGDWIEMSLAGLTYKRFHDVKVWVRSVRTHVQGARASIAKLSPETRGLQVPRPGMVPRALRKEPGR